MLFIKPEALHLIAVNNGWVHEGGRLKNTINAAQMAQALDVAPTTITRAYDGSAKAGMELLEKLRDVSGLSLDALVEKRSA